MEHLCLQAVSSPVTLANARTNILFGFINCLANNNYTPDSDQWTEIKRQISLNPILDGKNYALPWAKLCLEMASLGHYEDKLLTRVFSQEFLNDYLGRDNNVLDYLQLLTLHEAVKAFHSEEYTLPPETAAKAKSVYPVNMLNEKLEECVARGLGGKEYAVRNVVLSSGFVAGKTLDLHHCLINRLQFLRRKDLVDIFTAKDNFRNIINLLLFMFQMY